MNDIEPVRYLAAKIPLAELVGNAELRDQAFWPKSGMLTGAFAVQQRQASQT